MDDGIDPSTCARVLERLGLDEPPSLDEDGLALLYRRWCRQVPFDNVRKLIALRTAAPTDPLPGMDATDFLETWLAHGTGGTCWPSANALNALIGACGFSSRLVAASMGDMGAPTHGTTVVSIGEDEWLVDSSMLTNQPLRLDPTLDTRLEHPVFDTAAHPVDEGWLFAFALPYAEATMPCRTISPNAVTHELFVERFEVSREGSPFNGQVSTRRNDDAGVVAYGGAKRYRRTVEGIDESDLDGAALFDALHYEFAMSEEIIDRLRNALAAEG